MFDIDGIKLVVGDDVLDFIVDKAVEYKVGARGLRSICETIMMDLMYEAPSKKDKEVVVTLAYAQERMSQISVARLTQA